MGTGVLSPELKQPGHKVNNLPPLSSAEFMNE